MGRAGEDYSFNFPVHLNMFSIENLKNILLSIIKITLFHASSIPLTLSLLCHSCLVKPQSWLNPVLGLLCALHLAVEWHWELPPTPTLTPNPTPTIADRSQLHLSGPLVQLSNLHFPSPFTPSLTLPDDCCILPPLSSNVPFHPPSLSVKCFISNFTEKTEATGISASSNHQDLCPYIQPFLLFLWMKFLLYGKLLGKFISPAASNFSSPILYSSQTFAFTTLLSPPCSCQGYL